MSEGLVTMGNGTGLLDRVIAGIRRAERITRPIDPEQADALARRWSDLPEGVRTPEQLIGRFAVGCEGTHGVFPRCNLTCTPCYHSKDANRVRTDGGHTLAQVDAQMAHLRRRRGPRAHAQLIGGEVSLLAPEDHAAALLAMRAHGREPMSMTHGDFDYDYLRRLAVDPQGRQRFSKLSFAAHFDSLMRGRRGIPRPTREVELNPYRAAFADMFTRLAREHGVSSYLAHNMTVTPANLGQVAQVVRDVLPMGYSMLSFQPAAYVGDDRRWREDFREVTPDSVWAEIQAGAGTALPHTGVQFGDPRCNRTAFGFLVGDRWIPLVDPDSPADLAARDALLARSAGVVLGGIPIAVAATRVVRLVTRHPALLPPTARYARALVRRSGGARALLRHRIRPLTFVMHSFMDAAEVRPAWDLMQSGVVADDPQVRATQERLRACVYTMAHPESDLLVPACAQHSVLDPGENGELRRLLPLIDRPPVPQPAAG